MHRQQDLLSNFGKIGKNKELLCQLQEKELKMEPNPPKVPYEELEKENLRLKQEKESLLNHVESINKNLESVNQELTKARTVLGAHYLERIVL